MVRQRTLEVGPSTTYQVLDHQNLVIHRHFDEGPRSSLIDVFGANTCLLYVQPPEHQVGYLRDQQSHELNGETWILIPSFSIVEWWIGRAAFDFKIRVFGGNPPAHVAEASIIQSPHLSAERLFDPQLTFEISHAVSIGKNSNPSNLSLRVKKYIDNNWNMKIKLVELSKQFNTSSAVVSRYFKNDFGVSPNKYLNQVRIMSSLWNLIVHTESIQETSQKTGYQSTRQFYSQFQSRLKKNPSFYLKTAKAPLKNKTKKAK